MRNTKRLSLFALALLMSIVLALGIGLFVVRQPARVEELNSTVSAEYCDESERIRGTVGYSITESSEEGEGEGSGDSLVVYEDDDNSTKLIWLAVGVAVLGALVVILIIIVIANAIDNSVRRKKEQRKKQLEKDLEEKENYYYERRRREEEEDEEIYNAMREETDELLDEIDGGSRSRRRRDRYDDDYDDLDDDPISDDELDDYLDDD